MSARVMPLLLCFACSAAPVVLDGAGMGGAPFSAPQGLAVHSRFVVVANSAFAFDDAGQVVFGQGYVTLIDKETLRAVGRIDSTQKNPQEVAVTGDRAYVLNGGVTRIDDTGLARVVEGGGIDVLDLSATTGPRKLDNIPLGLSDRDARVGAYGSLALSPDGRRAYVGSGTRADLFEVDLEARRVTRGPDDPIVVVPTPSGHNGMVVARALREHLALLAFNDDALCLARYEDVTALSCAPIGAEAELIEGPVDLAERDDGALLVVMSLANALYAVTGAGSGVLTPRRFSGTGLAANAIRVAGDYAYVVNSLAHTLQRVRLTDGASEPSFVAFEVGANPYALAIDETADAPFAWVTLFGHDGVARVDLRNGAVAYVRSEAQDGAVTMDVTSPTDAGASLDATCEAPEIVAASEVVDVTLGPGGGHNAAALPEVVLGPPTGGGDAGGNAAGVLSLGQGGEIVLGFGPYRVVDGPGPDLIVFENPLLVAPYQSFAEPGIVGVSSSETADAFVEFPCDLQQDAGDPAAQRWAYPGCAGVRPVYANAQTNCLAADDPSTAGGDAFDLADIAVSEARYVRIRDGRASTLAGADNAGFDLDAVVLINYRRVDR